MSDDPTIKVYDAKAEEYAALVTRGKSDADLDAFMAAVTPGGRVLDLGCGPGNSAAVVQTAGFAVDAMDAAPRMVELARATYGIEVTLATFHDLDVVAQYDGIWANFSLLHAPKADFPGHLARIHHALKPGGVLHLGMKTGTGERVDSIGRFYAYYEENELTALLNGAGFTPAATRRGTGKGLSGASDPFVIIRAHA